MEQEEQTERGGARSLDGRSGPGAGNWSEIRWLRYGLWMVRVRASLAFGVLLPAVLAGCFLGPRSRVHATGKTEHGFAKPESSAEACNTVGAPILLPVEPVGTDTTTLEPSPTAPASPSASSLPSLPDPTPTPMLAGFEPAMRYAALDHATCGAELKKRGISYTPADPANGVDFPLRLTSKLHGVDFHGQEPPIKRATSVWEILDCRLVLALDDFSVQLAKHDIVDAVHLSMYRPPPKGTTKFQRHDAALAIDLAYFVKKDGSTLRVLQDWHGGIGQKTCVAGTGPSPATKEAVELRKILCDAHEAKLFHVMLTPNYNAPHANHFHLEVTRGVKWFIVH